VVVNPSPNDVRQQLERILGSEAFAGAGRHSRVLRYLVERTLAGDGDQLKEYVLGTEVFDRPDSYDPRIDSIVRVEVRRLRSRLEDYYRGPGANDPVVITIPRGAYVPDFADRDRTLTPAVAAPTPPPAVHRDAVVADRPTTRDPRSRTFAVIAAAVVVSTGLIVGTLALNSSRMTSAQAATGPSVAVLPFEPYSTAAQDVLLAAQITDTVTTELARLKTVSVTSRTSAAQYSGGGRSMSDIVKALNVIFVVEASAVLTGDAVRVSARLVYGPLDRKVWVGEYDFARSEIHASARQMAAEVADAAVAYLNR
jgi:TolB-like protein